MPGSRRPSVSSRRALALYVSTIVGPTIVLLILGLASVQRQGRAIAELTTANIRLSGERLASEVERRVSQLADACLHDDGWSRVPSVDHGGSGPIRPSLVAHRALEAVRRRHPIAAQLFVFHDRTARYPALRTPVPLTIEEYVASEPPRVRDAFLKLFRAGEDAELLAGRTTAARPLFARAWAAAPSPASSAIALERLASLDERVGAIDLALREFQELADRYPEEYDLVARPQALVAAVEIAYLNGSVASPAVLAARRDLMRGRWAVSGEQAEYFQHTLADPTGPRESSSFMAGFELARALEEGFQHHGPAKPGEIYSAPLVTSDRAYQIVYAVRPPNDATPEFMGLSVDLGWVREHVLPDRAAALGASGFDIDTASGHAAANGSPRIMFARLFPFWSLVWTRTPNDAPPPPLNRSMLVFTGSTALVLGVLVLGVVLLMRDVARERQLNQLRADFVSGVSHELKTPLTLIRLYADTLSADPAAPEHERLGYYEIITRESERLTALIERVLDFSRIDRGQKTYQLQVGALTPIVTRTVQVYGQYLNKRGFEVQADLAADLPPVRFDPEAVAQALVNLMDNAAKYSGDERFIAVRLCRMADAVAVEVEDRGIGISPDHRDKIFDRFYRAANGSGRGGYGLGLFLVKHVMDAHGGAVQLESERGKGSRFRLLFPLGAPGSADVPQT